MSNMDLISRQDAVKSMTNAIWHYPNEMYAQLNSYEMAEALAKDGLMGVPSAQQWIPCSERLPEKDGKYLITGRQGAINILKFEDGRWYGKWGVLAWRPLPEPYKGEQT